jgi:hypothetical protein
VQTDINTVFDAFFFTTVSS